MAALYAVSVSVSRVCCQNQELPQFFQRAFLDVGKVPAITFRTAIKRPSKVECIICSLDSLLQVDHHSVQKIMYFHYCCELILHPAPKIKK